jgi:cyanophycinase
MPVHWPAMRLPAFALLLVWTSLAPISAQAVGPDRGSLVIVGGGTLSGTGIFERFLELAGGGDELVVVIPTAGEDDAYDESWEGLRQLRVAGARRLRVLHTRDRKVADMPDFVAPIREARGVWFPGGRHWRLADAYLNTRTHRELEALLARGGTIGGTSAGATILGSFMVRGDTKGNELMVGDHTEGFGFIKGATIDQHLLKRNRQFDLIPVIMSKPELLGIGLDESTAIVVRRNAFEVIGNSYVAVYDADRTLDPPPLASNPEGELRRGHAEAPEAAAGAKAGSGGQFYFLAPGDRYDMEKREATRETSRREALPRVKKNGWKKSS